MMKTALIYSDKFLKYDYGPTHPFKMIRLKLTEELIKSYGLIDGDSLELEPVSAEDEDVLTFHTSDYLDILKGIDEGAHPSDVIGYGLGFGDNPIFKGIYEGSMLVSGGSLMAARLAASMEYDHVFNIAGGLHHAMRSRASGFCYLNDPAIAIFDLISSGKRVVYIDIDAHHGDGVQAAFYDTDKALTISFHENGRFLFPGTGFVEEMGTGEGEGYAVNVSFLPGTTDDIYEEAFDEIVPPLIESYNPDIIVAQLGADSLLNDPLSHFSLSNLCFGDIVKKMKGFKVPIVALGGGGYDVVNVYRAWTLVYSILSGRELPDELPQEFKKFAKDKGYPADFLRDGEKTLTDNKNSENWKFVKKEIEYLKKNLFPIHDIG
jgi:acetoin utilization protein AcuC